MQQQPRSNFLLFVAMSCLFFAAWLQLKIWMAPPPRPRDVDDLEARPEPPVPSMARTRPSLGAAAGLAAALVQAPPPARPTVEPAKPAPITPEDQLVALGDPAPDSRFNLAVQLDPRGAGIRSVMLNKFQAANEQGQPLPDRLELVPGDANRDVPANALYHFRNPEDDRPIDTLGRVAWKIASPRSEEPTSDGRRRQQVAFETEVQGVRITKIYSLIEGDYHVGLEVQLARVEGEEGSRKLRYQLAGARGLPIEGRWYTQTFRNALIGRVDPRGNVWRDLQTLQEIGVWEGGKDIAREADRLIRYAAIGVQYFAAAIVVDNDQEKQDFLKQARPTLETGVAKGVVQRVDRRARTFVLIDARKTEQTYHVSVSAEDEFESVREGARIAVRYHIEPNGRFLVDRFGPEAQTHALWYEDITVRVSTEAIEVKPDAPVVHKYLLYHGPVKPSLLRGLRGDRAVDPALVERYAETLSLNTMTDYHSPGAMGRFSSAIYWTQLIIKCTNLMHAVLGFLYQVVPSYGVCIVLLTVMVRGAMFPLSKKQALMGMKMQELAPELKKLQEKYKDDRQALGQAQMELYRKHGVNPFGTCWLLLLQMPVFMGLYFAFQESIQFRLAPFWPTWIVNLAAPDMLFHWGDKIPVISRPEDYGGILYLGPFFNLLPLLAVALMIVQQKMLTPPPTDEQQAMQQAMMKYMMIFFGLLFYRVASGLCIYFIASSMWGLAERKLLPKKKTADAAPEIVPTAASRSGKKPERPRKSNTDPDSTLGRLRQWWTEVLKEAEKK